MTARKASPTVQLQVTVDCLHAGDVLVKGHREWYVEDVGRRGTQVALEVRSQDFDEPPTHYLLDQAYLVTVKAEHDCQCAGSGLYYSGGAIVNGVYTGNTGPCFGCHGKGWQNRKDVIRNHTYWAKYARIGA